MARVVNGFCGNFTSITELNNKYPPAEHAGCSANYIDSNGKTIKYWSNGTSWAGADSVATASMVSGGGILPMLQRLNPLAMSVMTSPPTVTVTDEGQVAWTGSSLNTSGRLFSMNNSASDATNIGGAPAAFSVFRSSYPTALNTGYPDYFYTKFRTVDNGALGQDGLTSQISFIHNGSKFAFSLKGRTGNLFVKVNDQFVSLTPTAIANDGSLKIIIVDFGSAGTRRIDIIGYNLAPRGVWVDATDSIEPAPRRGLRACVIADSFGEGSGNEVANTFSWITYMAEFLGWDDVYACASGSTGLISNGGTKKTYGERLDRDVLALLPDVVIVQPSTNDAGQSVSAVLAAAQALYARITQVGIKTIFTSPSISSGAGALAGNLRQQSNAIKTWCASVGVPFVDWLEQPFLSANVTPHTTTITSSPAANATSFTTTAALIPGATYRWPDGTASYVRSTGGAFNLTATVDRVPTAQTSGTTIVQVGAGVFTGTGKAGATTGWGNCDIAISSDGTHPLNLGHRLLGEAAARQIAALRTLG